MNSPDISPACTTRKPVRLAGRTLGPYNHVCAFFNSREEQNKVLMPFFKEGYDRGEKLLHIVDKPLRDEHMCACAASGIDTKSAVASGQLDVRHWEESYLKDGYFDPDRMMSVLREALESNRAKYGLTRVTGNMEWALEDAPGVHNVLRYEAMLNDVLPDYPDPAVCVYDLNRHSASVVMDILRTHPMAIIGGVLRENPLYMPPDQFLAELEGRQVA